VLVGGVVVAAALLAAPVQAAPGDLDPSFGSAGTVLTDFGPDGPTLASGVALQPDGKIVAAGYTNSRGISALLDFALARYNPDGSLDSSFGAGGKVVTVFGAWISSAASAVALQPDGKIVAAGFSSASAGGEGFALVRYNPDGSLDASFGNGGKVLTDFAPGSRDVATALALQPDGQIVAAGWSDASGSQDFALTRYTPDGSLDVTFGTDGKLLTDFGYATSDATFGIALQSDGKIIAAGGSVADYRFAFSLARYNPDGSLDASFGNGGKVLTDFAPGTGEAAYGVALQPDGRIVAAGFSNASGSQEFALARYHPDGTLDASFGTGGKVQTDFPAFSEAARAVAVAPDGKIVAAGEGDGFALARYNPDGNLDGSFGTAGLVVTDLGSAGGLALALALQSDGKIVAAGGSYSDGTSHFALARYLGDSPALEVSVDIKPGSTVNPIKLASKGVVPVAILTSDSFDATTVDPGTVCFGDDDNPTQRDCTVRGIAPIEDVNADGRADVLLHFEVRQTGIDLGDTTACLTGKTFAGASIEGCDSIKTL
jgi:uncharacterized delta-60 repeat protein